MADPVDGFRVARVAVLLNTTVNTTYGAVLAATTLSAPEIVVFGPA